MDIELLRKHIKRFGEQLSKLPQETEKDILERNERILYYQSWTRDRILGMDESDLLEYFSKLWAMLIWGNKKYVVDKMIAQHGINKLRQELVNLVWGEGPVATRWDKARKEIKGMGPAMASELLCNYQPDDCMIWNRKALTGYKYLKVDNLPTQNYQVTGSVYKILTDHAKVISEEMKNAGIKDTSLLAVDYFIWSELQIEEREDRPPEKVEKSFDKTEFIHNDVRDAVRDIGQFLGFDAEVERKVAEGSKVDAVWESKIGNMGRIIYVFEVQAWGGLDSLVINLLQSLNNPAVQGVVAVSDKDQLQKIQNKVRSIKDLKDRVKYWDYNEVLKVRDGLEYANESINRLDLVPSGFF